MTWSFSGLYGILDLHFITIPLMTRDDDLASISLPWSHRRQKQEVWKLSLLSSHDISRQYYDRWTVKLCRILEQPEILEHFKIFSRLNYIQADPNGRAVWVTYCLPQIEHWDREFESHSRHGCVSAFFCVELSSVQVEALRRADHPSKESYQLSTRFISSRKINSEPEQAKRPYPWKDKDDDDIKDFIARFILFTTKFNVLGNYYI
jgi:hypothetical protein